MRPTVAEAPALEQLERIQPARIFIFGGEPSVGQGVVNQVNALFP